jgi:RNA polymerase sigma-70 factor (ECF subfamily)
MHEDELLADRFEADRRHLRAVAYRMLGSVSEADDAVQEAWLRASRAGTDGVENLGGWLTTIVARVCLNMLRSRKSRREDSLDVVRMPDPIVSYADGSDPEHEAVLTDSVGLALLVVLDTLAPAERLAFVLHDMFDVPFNDIAPIVDRSPAATRQLASRGRHRVAGAAPAPDVDLTRQREVVEAFLAAAREGDFDGLVAVLDPDVTLRADGGPDRPALSVLVQGAETVASRALMFSKIPRSALPVVVNGVAGVMAGTDGRPFSVMSFTVAGGRIVAMHVLADPERLATLDLPSLSG